MEDGKVLSGYHYFSPRTVTIADSASERTFVPTYELNYTTERLETRTTANEAEILATLLQNLAGKRFGVNFGWDESQLPNKTVRGISHLFSADGKSYTQYMPKVAFPTDEQNSDETWWDNPDNAYINFQYTFDSAELNNPDETGLPGALLLRGSEYEIVPIGDNFWSDASGRPGTTKVINEKVSIDFENNSFHIKPTELKIQYTQDGIGWDQWGPDYLNWAGQEFYDSLLVEDDSGVPLYARQLTQDAVSFLFAQIGRDYLNFSGTGTNIIPPAWRIRDLNSRTSQLDTRTTNVETTVDKVTNTSLTNRLVGTWYGNAFVNFAYFFKGDGLTVEFWSLPNFPGLDITDIGAHALATGVKRYEYTFTSAKSSAVSNGAIELTGDRQTIVDSLSYITGGKFGKVIIEPAQKNMRVYTATFEFQSSDLGWATEGGGGRDLYLSFGFTDLVAARDADTSLYLIDPYSTLHEPAPLDYFSWGKVDRDATQIEIDTIDTRTVVLEGIRRKIGVAYDLGGETNLFNTTAIRGSTRTSRKPISAINRDLFPATEEERTTILDTLVADDPDVIYAVGFSYNDLLITYADNNPDIRFGGLDITASSTGVNENLTGINFNTHEGEYLCGILAGHKTETKKVGCIVGVANFPLLEQFVSGFKQGLDTFTDLSDLDLRSVSTGFDGFFNPDGAKAIAREMYLSGVDIIQSVAGNSSEGLYQAAKEISEETGIQRWVIGVDVDVYELVSDDLKPYILTSFLKNLDGAMMAFIRGYLNLDDPVANVYFGLKDRAVGFATSGNFLSQTALDAANAAKDQIISGDLVVASSVALTYSDQTN